MKISKKEQEKNRKKLIQATVELADEIGLRKITMAKIARRAGMSESTIYNYFKHKEKIYFAYFEERIKEARTKFNRTNGLDEYGLQESLQLYMDMILESYAKNEKFTKEVADMVYHTPFSALDDLLGLKEIFAQEVVLLLERAVEKGEIQRPPSIELASKFVADFFLILVNYWAKDQSEDKTQTTNFMDLSLGLIVAVLVSGIINKGLDLIVFLLRQHLTSAAGVIEGILRHASGVCETKGKGA